MPSVGHEKVLYPQVLALFLSVYSWFAIGEYITVISNIAFHGVCIADFRDYSFTVLPTEELQKPPFKDK